MKKFLLRHRRTKKAVWAEYLTMHLFSFYPVLMIKDQNLVWYQCNQNAHNTLFHISNHQMHSLFAHHCQKRTLPFSSYHLNLSTNELLSAAVFGDYLDEYRNERLMHLIKKREFRKSLQFWILTHKPNIPSINYRFLSEAFYFYQISHKPINFAYHNDSSIFLPHDWQNKVKQPFPTSDHQLKPGRNLSLKKKQSN